MCLSTTLAFFTRRSWLVHSTVSFSKTFFNITFYQLLQIKHSTTTPYHPQCNSQAEVQNKIIAKYLSSFVDSTTLDWPLYMAPMAFAYNTALHRSIKATPFFLTYGIEPRLPAFPTPDLRRYYGQSDVAEWFATLQHCRQLAMFENTL